MDQPVLTDDGRVLLGDVELRVGERHGDLVLRAIVKLPWQVGVVEHRDGSFLIANEQGDTLRLTPLMEAATADAGYAVALGEIMAEDLDRLGEEVLSQGEPSMEAVARALPRLVDYGFVGHPAVAERVIIHPDGSIEGLLGPLTHLPAAELRRRAQWGIVDALLPLPVLAVRLNEQRYAQQIVVPAISSEGKLQPLVRRAVWDRDEEKIEYLAPGSDAPADAAEFYRALLRAYLEAIFDRLHMSQVRAGDQVLVDLALSSLRLADLTTRGCRPRYGIGVYDQPRHHSFPPATLHLVQCLIDWGMFERARDLLNCYLDCYVKEDGTFDYYGPALAEYGQMLSLTAHFASVTGDERWWKGQEPVLRPIWRRLIDLRHQSLADGQAPAGTWGLVPGLPEADYHTDQAQWHECYFSGNAWAVRGLMDVARMLFTYHQQAECAEVFDAAQTWREDLEQAVLEARVPTERGVFVAPGPTQRQPIQHMTESRHASYVNYRYWAEMISAGVLDRQIMDEVLQYRRSHGGELLGMTRFEDRLDDWPVLHYARALLELGEVDRYLLLLYAHLAHHQALGWLTAYEQVSILPDESGLRRQIAGQVTPSQVTVPQMLRWALAYEAREEPVLLVAPGVAWHWIADKRILAANLPTTWGTLSYFAGPSESGIYMRIDLAETTGVTMRIRIPAPRGTQLSAVVVNGRRRKRFDAQRCLIDVFSETGEVELEATF